MKPMRPLDTVADVIHLLAELGDGDTETFESGVLDQLQHGLQCAHLLASQHPDDLELQVAGLLHDIGHRLIPGDDAGHGQHGAAATRIVFGSRVADLIELHVPAKRYLISVHPDYADLLSTASVATLRRQGGGMTDEETRAFEACPEWADSIVLRLADDAAKVPGRPVPQLGSWRGVLEHVARCGP